MKPADGRMGGSAEDAPGLTPFQTVGPYFAILPLEGENIASTVSSITLEGVVRDGAGVIVPDALIETWQADASGHYDVTSPSFRGFARAMTDEAGRFEIRTIRPGAIGQGHAPHILVGVLSRGVLTRFVTRVYFPEEAANATDPILGLVPAARRATLIAVRSAEGHYRFDITLQGPGETVFFDV